MKKLMKIEVIQEPMQLIENDLSFDALQQNDLRSIVGGDICKCNGGSTYCRQSYTKPS
jgi:hypothetical protein